MNSAADECSWRELKLVRITPRFPGDAAQAEVLEAVINDIPENRAEIRAALAEDAEMVVQKIISREQRGLGWIDMKDWREVKALNSFASYLGTSGRSGQTETLAAHVARSNGKLLSESQINPRVAMTLEGLE